MRKYKNLVLSFRPFIYENMYINLFVIFSLILVQILKVAHKR